MVTENSGVHCKYSMKSNASGQSVAGAIIQSQSVTTQTETLSQKEMLQHIPEWIMKDNSSGLVYLAKDIIIETDKLEFVRIVCDST